MELKLVKEAILQRVILRLARIQIQVQPQKIKYKPIKKGEATHLFYLLIFSYVTVQKVRNSIKLIVEKWA